MENKSDRFVWDHAMQMAAALVLLMVLGFGAGYYEGYRNGFVAGTAQVKR